MFKILNFKKKKLKLYITVNRIWIAADVETRKENGWGKAKREKTPYFHCDHFHFHRV